MMQRRLISRYAILSMFLIIIGCATDNYSSRSTVVADREAVMKVMDLWLEALRESDIETYFTLYEEDAVWIVPGSNMGVTKEIAQQVLQRVLLVYDFSGIVPRTEEVTTDCDLAYAIASYSGIRPKDVHHVEIFTHHIYILRKQDDGSWKIARNMWVGSGGEQFAPPSK